MTKIIEQGVQEKTFHADYPAQMADYICTAAQSLSDVFSTNLKECNSNHLDAFLFLLQQTLGMESDAVLRPKKSFSKVFLQG